MICRCESTGGVGLARLARVLIDKRCVTAKSLKERGAVNLLFASTSFPQSPDALPRALRFSMPEIPTFSSFLIYHPS